MVNVELYVFGKTSANYEILEIVTFRLKVLEDSKKRSNSVSSYILCS